MPICLILVPANIALACLLACAAALFYVYAGYPLLLEILALLTRPRPAPVSTQPSLTLLICARNEAADIGRKLQETLALNYPPSRLQVLVVSDGSTDATDSIVRSFAPRGVELLSTGLHVGKTEAQNRAVAHARGDILVFSDATTHYHPDALRYLAGQYLDPATGAVSGRYAYRDVTGRSSNGAGARAFAGYDNRVRLLQSRVATLTGCCGCIYSVRRELYTPLAPHIISDLVQPLHVLRKGYRVRFAPQAVAWEAATPTAPREFRMRVRVIARALRGLASVPQLLMPWRHPWIALQLWSHKLLRWSVPLFLVGLFVSSACLWHTPLFRAIFLCQAALYLFAAATLGSPLPRRFRVLGLPLYFCTINAAAVAGILQFLRGRSYAIWQPDRESAHANR